MVAEVITGYKPMNNETDPAVLLKIIPLACSRGIITGGRRPASAANH